MLAEANERAKSDPALAQTLLTVSTNQLTAIGIYGSFGFVRFGTEPRVLRVDDQYLDEHYLILALR